MCGSGDYLIVVLCKVFIFYMLFLGVLICFMILSLLFADLSMLCFVAGSCCCVCVMFYPVQCTCLFAVGFYVYEVGNKYAYSDLVAFFLMIREPTISTLFPFSPLFKSTFSIIVLLNYFI